MTRCARSLIWSLRPDTDDTDDLLSSCDSSHQIELRVLVEVPRDDFRSLAILLETSKEITTVRGALLARGAGQWCQGVSVVSAASYA